MCAFMFTDKSVSKCCWLICAVTHAHTCTPPNTHTHTEEARGRCTVRWFIYVTDELNKWSGCCCAGYNPKQNKPPSSLSLRPASLCFYTTTTPPPNSLCLNVSLVVGIFSFLPYFLIASSPLILRSQTLPDSSCITMREYQNLQFLSYFHSRKEKKKNWVWSHFVELEHKSSVSPSRCPGTFGGDIITDFV